MEMEELIEVDVVGDLKNEQGSVPSFNRAETEWITRQKVDDMGLILDEANKEMMARVGLEELNATKGSHKKVKHSEDQDDDDDDHERRDSTCVTSNQLRHRTDSYCSSRQGSYCSNGSVMNMSPQSTDDAMTSAGSGGSPSPPQQSWVHRQKNHPSFTNRGEMAQSNLTTIRTSPIRTLQRGDSGGKRSFVSSEKLDRGPALGYPKTSRARLDFEDAQAAVAAAAAIRSSNFSIDQILRPDSRVGGSRPKDAEMAERFANISNIQRQRLLLMQRGWHPYAAVAAVAAAAYCNGSVVNIPDTSSPNAGCRFGPQHVIHQALYGQYAGNGNKPQDRPMVKESSKFAALRLLNNNNNNNNNNRDKNCHKLVFSERKKDAEFKISKTLQSKTRVPHPNGSNRLTISKPRVVRQPASKVQNPNFSERNNFKDGASSPGRTTSPGSFTCRVPFTTEGAEKESECGSSSGISSPCGSRAPANERGTKRTGGGPLSGGRDDSAEDGLAEGEGEAAGGASPDDPLPNTWPAWVYCTRYSDRPSSGM